MTDDQILMGAIPASREYVLPKDDKKYRGFTLPPNMSGDQEKLYKAAIDEREAGAMQREMERGASDRAETTEDAAEIFSAGAGAIPTPPSQIAAAGADAYIAGRDIQRGDYGLAAVSAASVAIPFVSAGMLKAAMRGGSEAAEVAAKKIADVESGLKSGDIDEVEAKKLGDAITAEYDAATSASGFPEYTGRSADFMKVSDRIDPEDLAMQRRQDVYEGITTDMRGTPRVEPPSRNFTPDQMDELESEARRLGLSTVDELLDLQETAPSLFRTGSLSQGTQALDAELRVFSESDLGQKLLRGSDADFDRYTQMQDSIKSKYPDDIVRAETYGSKGLPVTTLSVKEAADAGSNTIAKQFVSTPLAQQVLSQLDDVPNKAVDSFSSGRAYSNNSGEYSRLLDLSSLSDEQLEALRKRHSSVSGEDLLGFESFKIDPASRRSASYTDRNTATTAVRDARDRMMAIGKAVSEERQKRAEISDFEGMFKK